VWVGFDQPRTIMPDAYAGDVAVPLWTDVMKAATAGDKAEWLARPEGLVAQTVCRLSGKLAGEGCHSVEVTNDLGEVEIKSMAYTEYFRRGTAPTDYCTLHTAVLETADVGVDEDAAEAGVAATAGAVEAGRGEDGREAAGAPKKKRGFWSRLFGRGDDEDEEAKAREAQRKREQKKREEKKDPQ
jgi:penicillin-binding protein 1A